jgi:hypothetical protein
MISSTLGESSTVCCEAGCIGGTWQQFGGIEQKGRREAGLFQSQRPLAATISIWR